MWGIGLIDEPRKQRFVRDHGQVFVEHLEVVEARQIRQVAACEIVWPRTWSFGQLPSWPTTVKDCDGGTVGSLLAVERRKRRR